MTEPPASPPPYGQPPEGSRPAPPPYGAPPSSYGGPPSYQGSQYGGPIPGQAPGDPAPMGLRLVARIIDGVLIFAVVYLIALAVGFHPFATHTVVNTDGTTSKQLELQLYSSRYFKLVALEGLLTGVYEVGMIAIWGATLGKLAMGIKVVKLSDRSLPGFIPALARWVLPTLAGLIFGPLQLLLFISPFFDRSRRNRGWYDMAAGTIAVRSR